MRLPIYLYANVMVKSGVVWVWRVKICVLLEVVAVAVDDDGSAGRLISCNGRPVMPAAL